MRVYLLRNSINGKCYVGQTRLDLRKRIWDHKATANSGATTPLYHAIRKYGWSAFEVETLEECVDLADLDMAERYWIGVYRSLAPDGYNLETGGYSGKTHGPESRRKIGDAHRGKVVSAETRRKQSEAKEGRQLTDEQRRLWSQVKLPGMTRAVADQILADHKSGMSIRTLAPLHGFSRWTIARLVKGQLPVPDR